MKRRVETGLLLALLLCAVAAWAQYQYPNMASVQKVYIDKLGNSDDAERFRFQAARALGTVGFTPWDTADGADTIMKGTFTYTNWGEKTGAQANVQLISTRDNKEVWALSVADPKIDSKHNSSQWVADELAKRLKKEKDDEIKRMKK